MTQNVCLKKWYPRCWLADKDSASRVSAICLQHEKCALIKEWRLQAQYWFKFMSIFQRQRRVYLVQATGWKQYLPCFSGPAEVPASGFQLPPVFVQNCMSSMLYKGETQICHPSETADRSPLILEGSDLAQELHLEAIWSVGELSEVTTSIWTISVLHLEGEKTADPHWPLDELFAY